MFESLRSPDLDLRQEAVIRPASPLFAGQLEVESELTPPTQLMSAHEFDLADFFGVTSPPASDIAGKNVDAMGQVVTYQVTNGGEETEITPDDLVTQPQKLAQVWRVMADKTQTVFTSKISADTFAAGEALASQTLSWLGNLVGACGPLCSHGLMSALSASGGSVGGGVGGSLFGSADGLFTGSAANALPPFDWKTAATELEKNGAFWYGDQKINWADLVSVWSRVLGESLGQLFGFGIIDCLLDGLLPGQQRQQQFA